jgi:hypothetical protein
MSMMPKSVKRFSDNIMLQKKSMMPKSVKRFSQQHHAREKESMGRDRLVGRRNENA